MADSKSSDLHMDRHKFSMLALGLAFVYWFAESVIHRFVYAEQFFEVVPSDVNEFWMRLLIILLIVAFGFFQTTGRAGSRKRSERSKRCTSPPSAPHSTS